MAFGDRLMLKPISAVEGVGELLEGGGGVVAEPRPQGNQGGTGHAGLLLASRLCAVVFKRRVGRV